MKVEKLLDKLATTHDRACRSLDKFHRYTAGTATADKCWDAHCRASEAFAQTLSELRRALGVPASAPQTFPHQTPSAQPQPSDQGEK